MQANTSALIALVLLSPVALAVDAPDAADLGTVLGMAREHSPQVTALRGRVLAAQADLRRAEWARFAPKFKMKAYGGPSPAARCVDRVEAGDPATTPRENQPTIGSCVPGTDELADLSSADDLGIFGRVEVDLVQPLYTFGRIGGAIDAAEGQIELRRAEVAVKAQQVAQSVAEAWWGLQAAREGRAVVDDVSGRLDEAQEKLEKRLAQPDSDASQVDLLKLKLVRAEVEGRRAELDAGEVEARAALLFSAGLPASSQLEFATQKLSGKLRKPRPVEDWLTVAAQQRPEMALADAGLKARRGQVDAEAGRYFPQLFVAGTLRFAQSTNRDDPGSPYIADRFNSLSSGVILGFEQNLSLHNVYADVQKAKAELAESEGRATLFRRALDLYVRRAHARLAMAHGQLKQRKKALRTSRSWMTSAGRSYDLGLATSKELLDGYGAYAQAKAALVEAWYEYRLAELRLRVEAGGSPDAPLKTDDVDAKDG